MEYLVISPTQRKNSSITLSDMLDVDLDLALKVQEYTEIIDSVMELEYEEMKKEQGSPASRGR